MKIIWCLLWSLVFVLSASAQSSRSIEGTWRWKFSMPDGSVANPILRLAFEQGKLKGTSSYRAGAETPITNVKLRNDEVSFQVIRERDGQEIITTYTGRWVGKTIKGKIESNWTGDWQTYNWEAEKVDGPNGVWKWTVVGQDRNYDARITLSQKGARLEGSLAARRRGGRAIRIKNGTIDDDGQLYFEVETGTEASRRLSKYQGKLTNDTITGTIETTAGASVRKSEWVARRVL